MNKIKISSTVYKGTVDGKCYLMDMHSQRKVKLNQTGNLIWCRLKENQTPEAITQELCARFPEVPSEKIDGDVSLFVDGMVNIGFAELMS